MIVVDASVVLELLLQTDAAEEVAAQLFADGESLHAPDVIDLEVVQVLRRYNAGGELSSVRGAQAIEDYQAISLNRYGHFPFLDRMWGLRSILGAYDAAYVALAEALDSPLLTRDGRMAGAAGHRAAIKVI